MTLVSDLVTFLGGVAPPELAEEWDNVGLLVGDGGRSVARVMTCLTLTGDVAREAIDRRADMVVTHHPVLFRGVKRLTSDDSQGAMLLDVIAARVSVYSPHTAYDSAAQGINSQLAELLGLADVAPLQPVSPTPQYKIVCFVPQESLESVQHALWAAGAGRIGEYSQCSFSTLGVGTFCGSAATRPAVGQAGRFERVEERRLEVDCPAGRLMVALKNLRLAHPYEEPAYDVYRLEAAEGSAGTGRMGRLPAALPLAQFAELVKLKLRIPRVQIVGEAGRLVERVGIACGAGGELLGAARAEVCDVLLTGEARFHACLEARAAKLGLVLAGHYATERPAMEHLSRRLAAAFPGIAVWASETESDPLQWL